MKYSDNASIHGGKVAPVIDKVNFADPIDGTLLATVLNSPLAVSIPMWNDPAPSGQKDTVVLEWAEVTGSGVGVYVELDRKIFEGPVESFPDAVLYIPVKRALERDGHYLVRYRLFTYYDTTDKSECIPVVCDSTPPYKYSVPPAFLLPATQITIPYFEANDDKFVCTIPEYSDCQVGDEIVYFWRSETNSTEVGRVTVPDNREIIYTRAQIEAAGNGKCFAEYRLYDKAGNQSQVSAAGPIDVSIAPRKLKPAKVDGATGSAKFGRLNVDYASEGATVRVLPEADIYEGEKIRIQWADPEAFNSIAVSEPESADPLMFKIPKGNIAAHMMGNLEGQEYFPVYYEVLDGASLEVKATSELYSLCISDVLVNNYPTLQCQYVNGNVLRLADIPSTGATVHVDVWPFMADDQYVVFSLVGLGIDGQNLEIVYFEHKVTFEEVTAKQVSVTVAKEQFLKFKVGVDIYFEGQVTFNNKGYWYNFRALRANLTN